MFVYFRQVHGSHLSNEICPCLYKRLLTEKLNKLYGTLFIKHKTDTLFSKGLTILDLGPTNKNWSKNDVYQLGPILGPQFED